MPYVDNIFGDLIEPEGRLVRHRTMREGVRHLSRISPPDPAPGQAITLILTTGGPLPYDDARCWWWAEDGDEQVLDLTPAGAEWDVISWGYVRRWEAHLPPQLADTMLRYRIAARVSGSDRWVYADTNAESPADGETFALLVDADPAPVWARQTVVYQVFLDRFAPGAGRDWLKPDGMSGFFGGTLRGLIEQLGYIQDLGFSAIWISPVFASPTHHGYDATDLFTVEPRLGTNEDLLELFATAHTRGMRVILDFVANHWSNQHPSLHDAQADAASPYHEWYSWKRWPDDYQGYFGLADMPELNLRSKSLRDHLIGAATHWLRAGADGLRLDYAYGPPHAFWAEFRRACRAAKPDSWLFGEIIYDPDKLVSYVGYLDGVLDFPLTYALRETFARRTWDLAQLESFLSGHEQFFPPALMRPSFLDNHDMNRFLLLANGEQALLRLAALVLFTLSGPPIVYYGTEVGVRQRVHIHGEGGSNRLEESRVPMLWGADQDGELLAYFRRLIGLRRENPALAEGGRHALHLDAAAGSYAYLRDGAAPVIVAINLGDAPVTIRVPRSGLHNHAADALNRNPVRVAGDEVAVDLPAQSGAFII
ncbi:DUF3459 domain-containing protein [Chloroflexales bacterium ZM16-3]|nr:DUF3459 domain-containing protein [Chloroflexales bacterium ZM16-3]